MISEKEYLKSYKMMNDTEKKDYLDRVVRWNDETFPVLISLAESWEKVPVKDFDEGLRLVSAIMNARPFISVVQRYDADRAIKKLNEFLTEVRVKSGLAKQSTRPSNDRKHYRAIVPEKGVPDENGVLKRREYVPVDVDGRTLEHLHEYINLLPPALQKKTQQFGEMYLALAEYRGRLEVLSESPEKNKDAMADFAGKTVKQEQEIRALWAEVDEAVAIANGAEPNETESDYQPDLKRPGDFTKAEIDAMTDISKQDLCKKKRIEGNKKYVRRTDVNVTDEYREQMMLRITELMEWEEYIPEKASEICEQVGIIVPGFNEKKAASPETSSTDKEK